MIKYKIGDVLFCNTINNNYFFKRVIEDIVTVVRNGDTKVIYKLSDVFPYVCEDELKNYYRMVRGKVND